MINPRKDSVEVGHISLESAQIAEDFPLVRS